MQLVSSGETSTGTLTLTSPPSSNAAVSLSSSNPSAATVPATVTVNAGATSATFTVTAGSVDTISTAVINATYGGATAGGVLTVSPGGGTSVGRIPQSGWKLLYVDSQETGCTNNAATNAFDGKPETYWFTKWCTASPGMPHEIQIDLGANYLGAPVSSGLLISNPADKRLQQVTFGVVQGRYVRLRALSEVNGGPWTDIAELNVLGN